MAKRRQFTFDFKTELILEVLSGATSQAELCRRTSMSMKTSPKREIASDIFSRTSIIRNAHIQR